MAGLGDDVYRYGYGKSLEAHQQGKLFVIDIIRNHMNDGWIPVDERLPEEGKPVLIQWERYDKYLDDTLRFMDVMWLHNADEKIFRSINRTTRMDIVAWRPLPEPYRSERSDNHDGE